MSGARYAAALASLAPDDRETVGRWLEALGMEPDELEAVPPLRQLVGMIAVLRLASQMDEGLPRGVRFREAAEVLGLNGSSMQRNWFNWQDAAVRKFFSEQDRAA